MRQPSFSSLAQRSILLILISAFLTIQFSQTSAQEAAPFPTLEVPGPSQQQAQRFQVSESQLYYYYEGQKVALEVAPEVVAVSFAAADASQQTADLARFSALLKADGAIQSSNPNYTLFQVNTPLSAQGALDLVNQLRQNPAVRWANPVFRVQGGYAVLTDELIARFPASWSEEQIRSFNATNGVEVLSRMLSNDNSYVLRATGGVPLNGVYGVDALTMANLYQESGQVVYAEPNFSNHLERLQAPAFTPNDSFFGQQWALNNTGQTVNGVAAGTADADIDAVEAWNITTGSSSVIIAIIDDAFDSTHVDLGTGTSKMVPGYDAFLNTGGFFPTPGTNEAHGTGTAGLAAAVGNNGQGVSGVCSGCRIMPIQVFNASGAATNAGFANGINYAWQNGAHILSNSWGGGSVSTAITNAIDAALASGRGGKGSVVVFAAGNSNLSPVSYPGSLTQVITVAASNLCDQRKSPTSNACNYYEYWWGPNSGPQVDVSAPGVGLYTTDIMGTNGYYSGNYTPDFNGTSGSTPIVSGVVGLVLSVNPDLTQVQVQQLLKDTANDIETTGFDNGTGWGRVNAYNAVMAAIPVGDTLAMYNTSTGSTSLIDTLQNLPAGGSYNTYTLNSPVVGNGGFVMGDWNGDGQKTPGIFRNGMFHYTNGIGPSTTWAKVWLGAFPGLPLWPVAGRFDGTVSHDCFGVVHPPATGQPAFVLHYHCDLSVQQPPGGLKGQWLGVSLPGSDPYQFAAGDWDNNGLDSIAARRGPQIMFSNNTPASGPAGFPLAQYIGAPGTGTSLFLAGDWDDNGRDSFGLFYPGSGYFYRRNDLDWNSATYLFQQVSMPVGTVGAVDSWRDSLGGSSTFDAPVPSTDATEAVDVTAEPTADVTAEPTVEVTEIVVVTEEPTAEPTTEPSPFPTLPVEGPSTATPTPFPTLPIEGPSTATPVPTPEFVSLPAHAGMDDGAADWLYSSGWSLSTAAAYGGQGLGWQVSAANTVEALRWSLPLDLRPVAPGQMVQLSYLSLLNSAFSTAAVQVSTDGVNWLTLGSAGAWGQWTTETVDLSSFVGQLVYVQFVWNGVLPADAVDAADFWLLDEVNVGIVLPTPTPTAGIPTVEPPPSVPTEEVTAEPAPPEAPVPTAEATAEMVQQ